MPSANRFRHQQYRDCVPGCTYHLQRPDPCPHGESAEFARRMRAAGEMLREANVAAIYLLHGTFVGPDVLGVLAEVGRLLPGFSDGGRRLAKQLVDALMGDVGNYTATFARNLEESLNAGPAQKTTQQTSARRIPVRLFHWSSENHHLGRADGAVRLLDELAAREFSPGQRVLMCGHSHAGNAFALVTNLLAGLRSRSTADGLHGENVARFFEAGRIFYRSPFSGRVDQPHWQRVHDLLLRPKSFLEGVRLDFVTFGTPIRYGWDTAGYDRLLHFVYHRLHQGLSEYRAPFPPDWDEVFRGCYGDFIHQLGIAGSNNPPALFSYRALLADLRFGRLLQQGIRSGDIMGALRTGMRVPEEGTTLLVDYGPPEQRHVMTNLAGHAVYTREAWMLYHMEEIARRLYGEAIPT